MIAALAPACAIARPQRRVAATTRTLAAITGAASIAGMVRLTTLWADFGSKLGFAAQRIGIASDQLQALQGAARLAGSSSEAMTNGMRTLGDNMVNAVGGRAPSRTSSRSTLRARPVIAAASAPLPHTSPMAKPQPPSESSKTS